MFFPEKEHAVTIRLPQSPRLRRTVAISALLGVISTPAFLAAEEVATEEWQITADKITRYENPQSIIAEGNIILTKLEKLPPPQPKEDAELTQWAELLGEEPVKPEITGEDLENQPEPQFETKVTIKADWAAYDVVLGSIKARGNVSVVNNEERLMADAATVNLNKVTGSFTNATLIRQKDDLHLEGEVIEKTGFKTYHIAEGWVITCKVEENETPPWSFSAADATVEEGGYAVLKHAKFNIKGVPIFYTPYMVLPAKNTRQTGLLFPELSNSDNNGFGVNVPFFWNISDSTDMTFYPQFYTDRGFMPTAEFRYVQDTDKKGTFIATYLDDKLSDPSETQYYYDTGFTHTNSDRYWLRGKIDHTFGDGWVTRLDVDVVSDRDYLTEFNSGLAGYDATNSRFTEVYGRSLENKTDDQRKNSLKILKSWESMSLQARFLAINDVRASDSSPTPLWKLPSLDFSGVLPIEDTDFTLDWDADYVNYWREDGIGGHRVDLYPKISSSLPLGQYFESRAELGLRETFYMVEEYGDAQWTLDETPNRFMYDFHAEVGTTLMRYFDNLNMGGFDSINHELRPYIEYDYRPEEDQSDLPKFDSVDRIGEANAFTYGIDNFFNLYRNVNGVRTLARQYGYFKVKQSYDLRSESSDEPFSDVNVELAWKPMARMKIEYETNIDVYGDGFKDHSLEGYYYNERGDIFTLDYRFEESRDIEQINATLKTRIYNSWLALLEIEHSIAQEETNEANMSLIYQAPCWSVEFQSNYTPTDTSFMMIFNLANIGSPFRLGS